MTKPIDLNEIRKIWTAKYGPSLARRMLAGAHPPFAAYDARTGLADGSRRPARDQDPEDSSSGLEQIKTFLRNRLDPADFQRLEQMLAALNGGGGGGGEESPDDTGSMNGSDEPEDFPGRPRAGGGASPMNTAARSDLLPDRDRGQAQDSRRGGGYFGMFPGNAKVGTSNYGS